MEADVVLAAAQRASRRRSAWVSAVSGTVIAAVVSTLAVLHPGFEVQRADLNDGSVWVVNGERQSAARANLQIGALDAVVVGEGADLEVRHHGSDVMLLDRVNAQAEVLDAARSTIDFTVPLPPIEPDVQVVGQTAVVHTAATGDLWTVPWALFDDFDVASVAPLTFGPDSTVRASDRYGLAIASPVTGEVHRLAPGRLDRVDQTWSIEPESTGQLDITIAAGTWWVLDVVGERVLRDGEPVDLTPWLAGGNAVLAQPSDDADDLIVATSNGLLSIDESGEVRELVADRAGEPIAPVVVDDCIIAAWTDGTAWRSCTEPTVVTLPGLVPGGDLEFIVRDDRVVLNDRATGNVWDVRDDGSLINNWVDLITEEEDEREERAETLDIPPEVDRLQQPPVAEDDAFGARPGQTTILPVVLNDRDPNGDVLVVSETTGLSGDDGARLDTVDNGQKVQLSLPPDAAGVLAFDYTITDGRGGSDTATVVVTVRALGENGAPTQVRPARTTVAEGGRVTANVLGEWVDPDGDPLYLADASVAAPDQVVARPDGRVTVSELGGAGEIRTVALTVSDGSLAGSGELAVTVRPVGQVPIIAEPFAVRVVAGEEVRVEPLRYVRGGTGTLRLVSVPERAGALIIPRLERGFFRFSSDEVRTHYLEYVVSDGDQSATGVVRIDVVAAPELAAPITVPKTAFVRSLSSAVVPVASTDIDPAGGVLVVTGITGVPASSGIRAEVLDQRDARITLTKPLDGPVAVTYRISNGYADAEGTITVIEIPRPDSLQPPIAVDDAVTVRVGDAVTIPVLDNDEHPDDEPITLAPDLVRGLGGNDGLLFVSGDSLRYLAPDRPGDFTAVYEVVGPLGVERAQATVRISVRESDEATNAPPVPRTITARVIAGETVRIRIPVADMDPDGDSVQLVGQETAPARGTVIDSGLDFVDYQAGEYAAGTDEFRYTVVDALGARASGTIRVGISPRLGGARNPIANDDQVVVRPGGVVTVPVLSNDSDPSGGALRVTGVESGDPQMGAEVVDGGFVRLAPPAEPGIYGAIYTIENDFGGASQAFVTVSVVTDAPLQAPVARDVVLTLTDILERDTVDVDVLARAFFAEGSVDELGVRVVPGYSDGAVVLPDDRIRVTVGERRQIIPFALSHPADPSVTGTAFIWVPGTADALPQRDRRAPSIQVVSEETVTIPINDYVVAVGGREVRLTDTATVRATNADGSDLVVDEQTLRFRSADLYFGPASIAFEVTDGVSADDPDGRVATIVLPIEVTARENQPPVVVGASIELEPGTSRELDLVRVTSYPYPDDVDELAYTLESALPAGLDITINGQRATVSVAANVPRGTRFGAAVGVRDDAAEGTPGRIDVTVVPSTRPLARPIEDAAVAPRGETTVVDVLANDQATNPFPLEPLRVVAIRGLESASIPAGVQIRPTDDGQAVAVTVSDSAEPGDTLLEYQVADATGDPERLVWGSIRISVQDVPDAVTALRVQEFGDRSLTIAWQPGASNNAPIERFDATVTRLSDGTVTAIVACASSPCTVPTTGNGPDNRVRIAVSAVNAQGSSVPTTLSDPVWSDLVPPAPAALSRTPLDGGLRVTWEKPSQPEEASPIRRYVVTVGPVTRELQVPATDPAGTAYALPVVDAGALQNGTAYPVSVSARNDAFSPLTTWNSAETTGTPAGPPLRVAAPSAVQTTPSDDPNAQQVQVDWAGAFGANGRAIDRYFLWFTDGGGAAPSCTVTGVETGSPTLSPPEGTTAYAADRTSATLTGLTGDRTYRIVVYAHNGQGCTASVDVTAQTVTRPARVETVTFASDAIAVADGRFEARIDAVTTARAGDATPFVRYRFGEAGTASAPSALPAFVTDGTYGTLRSVQVQVCRDASAALCGDWSDPVDVPIAVSIDVRPTFTVSGETPPEQVADITWTPLDWTSPDSRGAYPGYANVEYLCRNDDGPAPPSSTGGSCTIGAPPSSDPRLEVRITVGGTVFERVYRP
ncbi:MAG TPA: Ig-like domain-containing protein [Microcella sp.]|nr:Ig-like domain-containing protein [Microcella sp.]